MNSKSVTVIRTELPFAIFDGAGAAPRNNSTAELVFFFHERDTRRLAAGLSYGPAPPFHSLLKGPLLLTTWLPHSAVSV